eukprot:SAG22_NODE_10362_length_539_cov_1.163636_2_plen_59_part_00
MRFHNNRNVSYWVMDPATTYFQNMLASIAATLTAEFNLSGVYIDQVGKALSFCCASTV